MLIMHCLVSLQCSWHIFAFCVMLDMNNSSLTWRSRAIILLPILSHGAPPFSYKIREFLYQSISNVCPCYLNVYSCTVTKQRIKQVIVPACSSEQPFFFLFLGALSKRSFTKNTTVFIRHYILHFNEPSSDQKWRRKPNGKPKKHRNMMSGWRNEL